MDMNHELNQTSHNENKDVTTETTGNEPTVKGVDNKESAFNFDLSTLWKENEAGVYDEDKITQLAKDLDNQKKSTSYFQSLYMKKNPVPETAEGYEKNFKADSMYERFMNDKDVKEGIKSFREWAFNNKVGEREANLFTDYMMKFLVNNGNIDARTPEQIEAQKQADFEAGLKEVQPMLDNLGRTLEENNKEIDSFLKSPSLFTNNPEMVSYLENLANNDTMGYKLVTLLSQLVDHKDIPVVTGTLTSKDKAALQDRLNKEDDPVKREAMLREYYGE